jgi:hypothetical protein
MNKEVFHSAFIDEVEKVAKFPLASKASKAAVAAKEKVKGKIPPKVLEFMKKHKVPLAAGGGFALAKILQSGDREKSAAEECPGSGIRSRKAGKKGKLLGFGKGKGPIGDPKE